MSFTYVIDEEEPVEFTAGPGEAYVISVLHGSTLSVKAMPGDGQQFLWDYTCVGTVRGDVLTIDVMNDCTVGGSLQKDYGKFELPIIIVIAVAIILGYAVFRMRKGLG